MRGETLSGRDAQGRPGTQEPLANLHHVEQRLSFHIREDQSSGETTIELRWVGVATIDLPPSEPIDPFDVRIMQRIRRRFARRPLPPDAAFSFPLLRLRLIIAVMSESHQQVRATPRPCPRRSRTP